MSSSLGAGSAPNLVPFQPSAWSDRIVVSKSGGTSTDSSPLSSADTLFIDWAVLNNGTKSTTLGFSVALYVDGNLNATWSRGPLPQNYYTYVEDYALSPLPAGTHTVKISADSGGVISESDESDNDYTKTITITAALPAIRIEPLSLSFTAPGPAGVQTVSANAPSPAADPAPAEVTAPNIPADKLLDPAQIRHDLAAGPRLKVTVNLAPPPAARTRPNFRAPAWVGILRQEIKQRQQELLDTLPLDHVKVRFLFENIPAFSAEVTPQGLQALQAHPRVASIEPVYPLEPHLAQGIPLIHGTTYRNSFNGAGVAIAICDTGIDYRHPRLGGGGFPNGKVLGGYDFGDNDADPLPNTQAHGTCCAGIAAGGLSLAGDYIGGVAYNAKLYALKITQGSTGSSSSDIMVAAWDWCVTHQYDNPEYPIMVISTSFGGGRAFATCDTDVPSMTTAANNAVAAGITVLASSGNDGFCDSIAWPACLSSVIAVGAVYDAAFGDYYPCVDAASCAPKISTTGCPTGWYCDDVTAPDKVTSFSNMANFIGLLAPGNSCSTLDIVGSSGYAIGDYFAGFGGTSAACPYAAGAVACLQSAAKALTGSFLSAADVRNRLESFGDPVTDTKSAVTAPRINLDQAIQSLPGSGQTFRIFNDGSGPLTINSIAEETTAPWINFAPAIPFDIAPGAYQDVTVTADFAQAPAGQSTIRLVVSSSDAANSPYPDGVDVVVDNPVNTAPSISAMADLSATADASPPGVPFTVGDAETPLDDLVLSAVASDTSLVPTLTISGSGSERTLAISPAPNRSGSCTITVTVSDGSLSADSVFTLTVHSAVVRRFVFYNGSAWDGKDLGPASTDDAAIATDKVPLFHGQTAAFANYTSYNGGINGIMVDIAGLPGSISAADFTFKVGNNNTPSEWAAGPAPSSVTVRHGAGQGGSDRVTLIWPNGAIQKQWLEVTVLPAQVGLATPDVFYFGNAIGDTGNSAANAVVNALDASAVRVNPRNSENLAPIDFRFDINRDKVVNALDASAIRVNVTNSDTALLLISP